MGSTTLQMIVCMQSAESKPDKRGGVKQKQKFVELVHCVFQRSGTLKERSVDHVRYIGNVLPVALKYGNDILGIYWTFQQDAPTPNVQQWCKKNFHRRGSLASKRSRLKYSIWDEFVYAVN